LKERELACPEGYDVADHWMDLLVTDSSLEEEDEYARSSYFMNAQDSSDSQIRNRKGNVSLSREGIQASRRNTREQLIDAWDAQAMAEQIDNASAAFANTAATDLSLPVQKYNTSWTAQYRVLVHRALKNSRSAISTPLYRVYRTHTVRDRTANFFFTRTYWVFDRYVSKQNPWARFIAIASWLTTCWLCPIQYVWCSSGISNRAKGHPKGSNDWNSSDAGIHLPTIFLPCFTFSLSGTCQCLVPFECLFHGT
jgi:hypothetical protein